MDRKPLKIVKAHVHVRRAGGGKEPEWKSSCSRLMIIKVFTSCATWGKWQAKSQQCKPPKCDVMGQPGMTTRDSWHTHTQRSLLCCLCNQVKKKKRQLLTVLVVSGCQWWWLQCEGSRKESDAKTNKAWHLCAYNKVSLSFSLHWISHSSDSRDFLTV